MSVTSRRAFPAGRSVVYRPHFLRRSAAAWFAVLVASACAGSHRLTTARPESDACVLIPPPDAAPESIAVALSSGLADPEQRQWRSTADRAATTQPYEMLSDVDCGGRLYPQLARISSSEVVVHAARRVRVRSIDPSKARDALDAGVDLLVSEDPAIVSYAEQREAFLTLRLPWEYTYVVLTGRAPPNASTSARLTLAEFVSDAVRGESRPARPPFWWASSARCAVQIATNAIAPAVPAGRVVYSNGDRVAQGVAERLVALIGTRSAGSEDSALNALLPGLARRGARAVAAGLTPSAFAAALRAGGELAYVLPLARYSAAACQELAMLQRAAPWLDAEQVIPLVDTRSVAIVRRGRVGLSVDADGSLRLLDSASEKNDKP